MTQKQQYLALQMRIAVEEKKREKKLHPGGLTIDLANIYYLASGLLLQARKKSYLSLSCFWSLYETKRIALIWAALKELTVVLALTLTHSLAGLNLELPNINPVNECVFSLSHIFYWHFELLLINTLTWWLGLWLWQALDVPIFLCHQ